MKLLIDDEIEITLLEVLNENEDLTSAEISALENLQPGESYCICICLISRPFELHPRVLAGINGTPAGVNALKASIERGKELIK